MARPNKQEIADRRKAFEVYRDMGKLRSYDRLQIALEPTHGFVALNRIQKWAKIDQWQARMAEYDKLLDPNDELPPINTLADFDQMDLLARAAYLALTRALASHPHAKTPQDFKSLIDASEKAIKLMERLRELGVGKSSKPAELQSVISRSAELFKLISDATRARFAAAGTPVKDGPMIEGEFTTVETINEPDVPADHGDQKQLAAPVESPLPEPAVRPVVSDEPAVVPKTMAERLAALKR